MFKKRKTVRLSVEKVSSLGSKRARDLLVVEEPLSLHWQGNDGSAQRLAATMRTPGEDNELAAGILFSEGLLRHRRELDRLTFCTSGAPNELNRLRAVMRFSNQQGEARLAHRPSSVLPQSACGLCGYEELANPKALVKWAAQQGPGEVPTLSPSAELLRQALDHLHSQAPIFAATGASHAVVLVDPSGHLLAAGEDVGRHNACDKAIGRLLLQDKNEALFRLPEGSGVMFSSRLSFELAAKAVRAGAAWIGSVGAPTHLAVELAQVCRLPTVGFCSHERYNRYVD